MIRTQLYKIAKLIFAIIIVFSGSSMMQGHAAETTDLAKLAKFSDVPIYHWANKYVAKMGMLGIVKGVGDGQFMPDRNVSRQEAVLMALRLMGLEDDAEASNVTINHGFDVDTYFKPYIDYAFNEGILSHIDELRINGQKDWGSQPAKREWIAMLTIQAIDQTEKAESSIVFDDREDISDWAVGYVNAAVDLGIVQGSNGKFLPQNYVKRSELATFFARAEPYLETRSQRVATGFVKNIDNETITILTTDGQEYSYAFSESPLVYSYTQSAPILTSDIEENQFVQLIQDEGIVYLVDVVDQTSSLETITGTYLSSNLQAWKLYLEVDGVEYSFDIDEDFTIIDKDGKGLDYASLVSGSLIEIRYLPIVDSSKVNQIQVLEVPINKDMQGEIAELDYDSERLAIADSDEGLIEEYPISDELIDIGLIPYGDREVSLQQLSAGDLIAVSIENSIITHMELIQPIEPIYEILHEIVSENSVQRDGGTLYVEANDIIIGYKYADQVEVIIEGYEDASIEDIAEGDEVTLYLNEERKIVKVEIVNRSLATSYLVPIGGYYQSNSNKSLIIEDEYHDLQFYDITDETIIRSGNKIIDHDQLEDILVEGEKVDMVYSTRTNTLFSLTISDQYEGTITRIDRTNQIMTLKNINGDELSFPLSSGTKYEIAGSSNNTLQSFYEGDSVVIELNSSKTSASSVLLKQTKTYKIVSVYSSSRKIKVMDANNTQLQLYITNDTVIKDSTKDNPDIGDLEEGQMIMVKLEGKNVAELGIAQISFGKVNSVNESNNTFTMTDYNASRKSKVFDQIDADVEVDDRVYVIVDPEGNVSIEKLETMDRTFWKFNSDESEVYFLKDASNAYVFNLHEDYIVRRVDAIVSSSMLSNGTSVRAYIYDDTIIELEIK